MARTVKRRGTAPRSKASAQYLHAKRRAAERYGVILDKDMYQQLCRDIQENRGECLGKQSNRLTVWRINVIATTDFGDQVPTTAEVVYDKQRHRIVTFLPREITDAKGVKIREDVEGDDSL
jgi:hypothetical protein